MKQFEFHIYAGEDDGAHTAKAEVVTDVFATEAGARAKAGRLAKEHKGPVDLARAGSDVWNERYITTASPSEYHATGYRFERLT